MALSIPAVPGISALTYALPTGAGQPGRITVTFVPGQPRSTITAGLFLGVDVSVTPLATGKNDGADDVAVVNVATSLLDPTQTYSVALSITNLANYGPTTILVFQQPVLAAMQVVGQAVDVRWTIPSTSNILSTAVSLYDTVNQTTLVSTVASALEVALALPQPVDAAGRYVVRLVGLNGIASGPILQSSESLILTSPAIASTVYAPDGVTVVAAGGAPPSPIYARLTSGDVGVADRAAAGTTAVIPLAQPLDPASRWQVALLYRSAITAGPFGVAVELPLTPPDLVEASFDGSVLSIAWTLPAQTTGASVKIVRSDNGAEVGRADIQAGRSATITPSAIDPAAAYAVQLAPYAGSARGLFGPSTPLIVARPTVQAATSDGGQLTVTLGGVAAPATGTTLELTSGGAVVASASAGIGAGAIALPSSPLSALAVTARATGAKVVGPAAAPLDLVAGSPAIQSVLVADGSATVRWAFGASATAFRVVLTDGVAETLLGVQNAPATSATVTLPPTVAPGNGIALRAVAGLAVGAPSAAVPPITTAPAVGPPGYDGATFSLAWAGSSDAGVLGYRVTIVETSQETVVSTTTPSTSISLAVALAAGTTYQAQVTAYGAGTTGPTASVTFTVPAATAVSAVRFDGAALIPTWAAVGTAGVTGYRVAVALDYAPALSVLAPGASTTSATVPATFEAGADVTVTVTAMAGNVAGPRSAPAAVVTVVPTLGRVFYDGTTLTASWSVAGGTAPAYTLAVSQGTQTIKSQSFTATSGRFDVALPGSGYLVTVGGVDGSSPGPVSAGVDPQSGPVGYFFAPQSVNAPFLFRSTQRPPYSASLAGADVVIYLPNVFTAGAPAANPQTTFTLAPVTSGGQIAYRVSVAASVVWRFDAASRTKLRTDYLAFLTWLEPALRPGAAPYIARALTLAMPLLFSGPAPWYSEMLLYRYGFDPGNRYVDLLPGMRLRLDSETFQLTSGGTNEGFVTSASAVYDLASASPIGGVINVAFDAFLSALTGNQIDAGSGGAGGIYDLYAPGGPKPYYRLFYPTKFPASSSQGSADPSKAAALAGCTSIANLESTTATYLKNVSFSGTPATVTYFRGRLVALPRIVVSVDGRSIDVPVGTTLRQLIGSWANLPFAESLQVSDVALQRPLTGVVDSPADVQTSIAVDQSNTVDFSDQTVATYAGGTDWFDLTLFGGDRIVLGRGPR